MIVALGPGADPKRLGPQPPNVLVTDFVSHALLLPRCDALVTQGGAGTILAALCHGLPHLILPQGADQFINAATAERAGVALQIPPAGADARRRHRRRRTTARRRHHRGQRPRVQAEIDTMPTPDEVLAGILHHRRTRCS